MKKPYFHFPFCGSLASQLSRNNWYSVRQCSSEIAHYVEVTVGEAYLISLPRMVPVLRLGLTGILVGCALEG